MKLISTDKQPINVDTKQSSFPMRSEEACKSGLQYKCGMLLRNKYPYDPILEEWSVADEGFFIDFFLPHRKLVVEVDGGQHKEYNAFFHGSQQAFAASKARDAKKELFCKINKLTFVRVTSPKELEEWLTK